MLRLRGDQLQVDDCIYKYATSVGARLLERYGESPDGATIEFYVWSQTQFTNVTREIITANKIYNVRRLPNLKPLPPEIVQGLRDVKIMSGDVAAKV